VRQAGLSPVAFCDRVRTRAEALCVDGALACTDPLEALAAHPDLVVIATDAPSHAALARQALRAGAHVLIEEPSALCLSDADRLLELARQQRRTFTPCQPWCFSPDVRALFDSLREKRLGTLCHGAVQIRRDCRRASLAGWQSGGGVLLEESLPAVDLLRRVFGAPLAVSCFWQNGMHPQVMAEDCAVAAVRFGGGALGVIEASACCAEDCGAALSVFGSAGSAVLGGDALGGSLAALYADAADAISHGNSPLVTGQDSRETLAFLFACQQSAATQTTVTLRQNPDRPAAAASAAR
jgi:predicted dehydrogenase